MPGIGREGLEPPVLGDWLGDLKERGKTRQDRLLIILAAALAGTIGLLVAFAEKKIEVHPYGLILGCYLALAFAQPFLLSLADAHTVAPNWRSDDLSAALALYDVMRDWSIKNGLVRTFGVAFGLHALCGAALLSIRHQSVLPPIIDFTVLASAIGMFVAAAFGGLLLTLRRRLSAWYASAVLFLVELPQADERARTRATSHLATNIWPIEKWIIGSMISLTTKLRTSSHTDSSGSSGENPMLLQPWLLLLAVLVALPSLWRPDVVGEGFDILASALFVVLSTTLVWAFSIAKMDQTVRLLGQFQDGHRARKLTEAELDQAVQRLVNLQSIGFYPQGDADEVASRLLQLEAIPIKGDASAPPAPGSRPRPPS